MSCLYIIKVGEICLKGGNRTIFEKRLFQNIKRKLSPDKVFLSGRKGRFFLKAEDHLSSHIEGALSRTFGVVGYARAYSCEKSLDSVISAVIDLLGRKKEEWINFKVETRRSDKKFEYNSYEISCSVGDAINRYFIGKNVRMKNPDLVVYIEIREQAFIYTDSAPGPGGLPVGTAGKGFLMLSGGIDSPVAGYLMAKRGLKLDAVYFHTPPYTSDETKKKVISISEMLSRYFIGIRLFVVDFTDIQMIINEKCPREYTTIAARSIMMKITDMIAKDNNGVAIVTGEALSQVASQTAETLRITGSYTDLPLLRPLIGFDKEEIIKIAVKIETYDISILPYDDCCSLFAPDHPATRPDFSELKIIIDTLDTETAISKAIENKELFVYRADGNLK